ncbi:glycosyltransferase [Arthrobacter sp.]|uniref:CgeB family protein n=1 Tax=Arthrobacter sp. TaxID=1667 RepID=UPI0028980E3D|nr:glycosyltransferase [Arthrobacter sp.]
MGGEVRKGSMDSGRLAELRRAAWHLRKGGVDRLRRYSSRKQAAGPSETALGFLRGAEGGRVGVGRHRQLQFAPAAFAKPIPARPELNVGVFLDDFSQAGFAWEFNCTPVGPDATQDSIRDLNLDLLLIESAWSANGGVWQFRFVGNEGPGKDIRRVIEAARALDIPVVLWNKEDPPHYDDFLPLARLCDWVFTTDANMLPRYRRDLGHDRVGCLPFAAQPKIHNPVRPSHGWHERDVAFAGMYFSHKYPERREQMDYLLSGAKEACVGRKPGFEIFSRYLGAKSEYQFPGELAAHVKGMLNYRQMLTAYKAYKIFLNVNSVIDSPTMCSRRIFEMTAAGAVVISAPSPALDTHFPDGELPIARNRTEARDIVAGLLRNAEYADRLVHRAQRTIWRSHTYRHRVNQILTSALPQFPPVDRPRVSVVAASIRPEQMAHVIRGVAAQRDVEVQLVYGAHGFDFDSERFHLLCSEAGIGNVIAASLPAEWSLGHCLNHLINLADGEVAAKWDDDDHYGEWYLFDQLQALEFSGASVVGKQARYVRLEQHDVTVLRDSGAEHRYTHFVAGPTLVGWLREFQRHPFRDITTGEDTSFLADVREDGGQIYAADRFNYVQVRHADEAAHTWQVQAGELLANSDAKYFGDSLEQVLV